MKIDMKSILTLLLGVFISFILNFILIQNHDDYRSLFFKAPVSRVSISLVTSSNTTLKYNRIEFLRQSLAEIYYTYKDHPGGPCKQRGNCACYPHKEIADEMIPILREMVEVEPSEPLMTEGMEEMLKSFPYSINWENVNCNNRKYASILTGNKRKNPARVFMLSLFSYEFDLLEIKFHEYQKVRKIRKDKWRLGN